MEDQHILQTQLEQYAAYGPYPMHMPGHKRRITPAPDLAFGWDMTEVTGVDDLHHAEGILAEAMERTAKLHGAARTWYLINGSTCGLLAGIRALAPAGSHIIAARNCHKAVYHAIELGGLHAHWLTPPIDAEFGVYGSISPEMVSAQLEQHPDAACVVLTSPTYEGVISDIAAIAQLCHSRNIPLLVDEAHGAHLGLAEGWPESAVHLGADLIVQSAHKTLPSLTQTALLHLGKNSLADPDAVARQLGIFETSSPSYPLMASLDGCTGMLAAMGKPMFRNWKSNLERFDEAVSGLEHLKVLCHGTDPIEIHPDFFAFDPGKLAISTASTGYTGSTLAELLLERFGFETEMSCGNITLAMTSLCDAPGAIDHFAQALLELDREASPAERPAGASILAAPGKAVHTIAETILLPSEAIPLQNAADRVSAEYIWAYPPGVPLVAPGEVITREFLNCAADLLRSGTELRHTICKTGGSIQVCLDKL